MRKIYAILFIIMLCVGFMGCAKDVNKKGDSFRMQFMPRVCANVLLVPSKKIQVDDGYNKYTDIRVVGSNSVKPVDLVLALFTGNKYIDSARLQPKYMSDLSVKRIQSYMDFWQHSDDLAPHITSLEGALESDYRLYIQSLAAVKSSGTSIVTGRAAYINIINWPYRTTGIKNMSITALTPLFGKPAGTPLNPYFTIYDFDPRQIISYTTQQLVWGYNDKTKIESIDQWLSLKPMAPPMMMLHLNTMPTEVPGICKFVVALETEAGAVIRDTTSVTFLAN